MTNMLDDSCTTDADCCPLPAEFVRLRYFFGQRLGVVDLTDEQRYVVGKQRFHNARTHGTGVLCGLTAERFIFPAGAATTTPTTVLRVLRGAALDGCGREIVVGWDHCVDVAAWFRKHVEDNETLAGWRNGDVPPDERLLWVAVCYRECESDPMTAPRDPCGCDAGGCEFSRIREGFSLELLTDGDLDRILRPSEWPPSSALDAGAMSPAAHVHAWVTSAVARSCAPLDGTQCLALARLRVVLDGNDEQVVDLTSVTNEIDLRLSLPTVADLQARLQQLAVDLGAEALPGPGPRFGALSLASNDDVSGTLSIAINLVDDEGGPVELASDPTTASSVSVHRFADDGTWTDVTATLANIAFVGGPTPHLDLVWTTGLVDQGRYRIVVESSVEPPPVDTRMRPLLPRRFVRHLRLQTNTANTLELSPTLYDA